VLDDVELLLENLDAETVVISSDHGNAIGEWGLYGHPTHVPLSCLVDVPWYRTTAEDIRTHEPESRDPDQEPLTSEEVKDRLADLGYM
jgi:glucan phosphoethanolaminetransferase (alkaline phosphatase superfamily)